MHWWTFHWEQFVHVSLSHTVECVTVVWHFSSLWGTRKGHPSSPNYCQTVSQFPPSQPGSYRALTSTSQVKTSLTSLLVACPDLFVKWPHCSWVDYCSFISPCCFPLTTVDGNSFSPCLLNMVKAIMRQVHGPCLESCGLIMFRIDSPPHQREQFILSAIGFSQ